jgi:hypothetical protein
MAKRKQLLAGLLSSTALVAFAGAASAQTIYDSEGFEPPTFTLGELEGQDAVDGPWFSDAITSTGVVTSDIARSGSQSVRLDRAPNDDSRWLISKPLVGIRDLLVVEADLRTAFSDVSESAYGPIFALEAYDAFNNVGGDIKLAGMVGMDAATGELLYQEEGTGFLAATGDILDPDTWYRLRLELDYSTDTYSIYLNGVRKATVGFVDPDIDDFTDADLAALAGAGDPESLAATGTGWFDNFSIKVGPQWAVDGGGTWTLSGNWIGGIPNAPGAVANFYGALVTPADAPATIALDGDRTVGSIRFNNTVTSGGNVNSYIIAQGAGNGTLILNNGAGGGRGSISVLAGTHTISAPVRIETSTDLDVTNDGNLRLTGPVSVVGGARLAKEGQGPARISGPITLATGAVIDARRGTLTIGSVSGNGGIEIANNARINVAPNGGTVVRVSNLAVAQNGTLDLNDNNLILDALPGNAQAELDRIEALVRQGRNGGSWNSPGITSTAARDNPLNVTGLAVIRNSDDGGATPILTTFEGQAVDANDILTKYTYNGDATLDGIINIDDYVQIDTGFLAQPENPSYRDGNFNYDDRIDIDDYVLIDTAYLNQGEPLLAAGGALRAVAVPEPGLLSLGSLAALGLLGRRRRPACHRGQ